MLVNVEKHFYCDLPDFAIQKENNEIFSVIISSGNSCMNFINDCFLFANSENSTFIHTGDA